MFSAPASSSITCLQVMAYPLSFTKNMVDEPGISCLPPYILITEFTGLVNLDTLSIAEMNIFIYLGMLIGLQLNYYRQLYMKL